MHPNPEADFNAGGSPSELECAPGRRIALCERASALGEVLFFVFGAVRPQSQLLRSASGRNGAGPREQDGRLHKMKKLGGRRQQLTVRRAYLLRALCRRHAGETGHGQLCTPHQPRRPQGEDRHWPAGGIRNTQHAHARSRPRSCEGASPPGRSSNTVPRLRCALDTLADHLARCVYGRGAGLVDGQRGP